MRATFLLLVLMLGLTAGLAADGSDSLLVRLEQAERVYRSQGPEQALPLFEALVVDSEVAGRQAIEARAIGFVGEMYWQLGDYESATSHLQRALAKKQALGDLLEEGKTLNVMGLLAWDQGDYDSAKTLLKTAAGIAEAEGDARLAGAATNNLSLVHDELGEYDLSLSGYHRALAYYDQVDFDRGRGDTLGNIGGVHLLLGRNSEALEYYLQALEISEGLGSPVALSIDHGNLGLAYQGLGQLQSAIEHLDQAIDLARASGLMYDLAYWLGVRANAELLLGHYDRALELHREGLGIYRREEVGADLAEALYDNGLLNLQLGDLASARSYFTEAMELSRSTGLARGITLNQLALGDLSLRQGETDTALSLYLQAAERARESGELSNWVNALLRMAAVQGRQGLPDQAEESATHAVKISGEMGALGLQAAAFHALGEIQREAGSPESAVENFGKALSILNQAPNAGLAWQVFHGRGLALADLGRTAEAIAALEAAIAVIEGVRNRLDQERYRAGYIQDKYQVYVDLVRLQIQAGDKEAAFSTAERLRSRSYREMVDARIPGELGDQASAEYALRERIRTLRQALIEEQSLAEQERRDAAVVVYSRELLTAEQTYQAMLDDRRRKGASRMHAIPSYADVRRRLEPGEALVEFVVGQDETVVFVLLRDALLTHSLELGRQDLDNRVGLVQSLIKREDSELWRKPAASLAKALLDPVLSDQRLEGVGHLFLVPHGSLNYLPFAVLPLENDEHVVTRFTLAYLPTAAALIDPRHTSGSTSGLLAMAPARSRLVHAEAEARAVNEMFDPNSRALLGPEATESAFKREAGAYRMLHLATHGYFNKLNPMLSGLELEADHANDGQLELHEILGLELNAELVTLSACQTGLGSGHLSTFPSGDDFVGLTRAFMYAGSSSVMATLWEVDDASTRDLMTHFYGTLRQGGYNRNAWQSLADAQRAMLASERHRHPYFWAPFVLVGGMTAKS